MRTPGGESTGLVTSPVIRTAPQVRRGTDQARTTRAELGVPVRTRRVSTSRAGRNVPLSDPIEEADAGE